MAGDAEGTDAPLQPPPIPPALDDVSAMVERSLLGTCEGKQPDLEGAGTLRVTLHNASGLQPSAASAAASDWYAVLRAGTKELRSDIPPKAKKTVSPQWDETFDFTGVMLGEVIKAGLQLVVTDLEDFVWGKSEPFEPISLDALRTSSRIPEATSTSPRGGKVNLSVEWIEAELTA